MRGNLGQRRITEFPTPSPSYNITADFGGPLCFLLDSPTTMSSYRNHRVIIATLFLPQTAVLGDSPPQTPAPVPTQLPLSSLFNLKIPERPSYGRNKGSTPLKSIVEDMRDKVSWDHKEISHEPFPSAVISITDHEVLTDRHSTSNHTK